MEVLAGRTYQDGFGKQVDIHSIDTNTHNPYPVKGKVVRGPDYDREADVGKEVTYMLDGRFLDNGAEKPSDSDLKLEVGQEMAPARPAEPAPAPELTAPEFQEALDDKIQELKGEQGMANLTDYIGKVSAEPSKNKLNLQAFIYALSETVPLGKLEEAATYAADQERGEYESKAAAAASFLLAGAVLEEK